MPETEALPVIPGLQEEKLLDCIHCGICLSACPTYDLLGTEADSPRGRIYMMRAVAEGRAELDESVVRHLDACLGCRACETACPSAVPYGEFLTVFRDEIERRFPREAKDRRARQVLLDLLTRPAKLAPLMLGARVMGGIFGAGGGPVGMVNRFLFGANAPAMPVPAEAGLTVRPLPAFTPARGEKRARVALLAGCVMQVLFQRINRATIRVLARNGCEVIVPETGCCGAFHMHNGYLEEARERARDLIRALERERFDTFVVNSAGCGSTLKEYAELFHGDPKWEPRGRALVEKTRDIAEFLAELGFIPPEKPYRKRVSYHDACHLAHGQGVRAQPRALLEGIPGIELVPLAEAEICCGSAGIYNLVQPEPAAQLGLRKARHVADARPDVIATGNPGCILQIAAAGRALGHDWPVVHPVEVVDASIHGGRPDGWT
jgi:glycolate oxidase iron-sulfur subunit